MTLDQLINKVEASGGIVTFASLKHMGVSPGLIAYAYKKGLIDKLTRGVYCSPDVFEDDFAIVCYRWRKCIFSHGSSLYLLGLSNRLPQSLDVTVPYGYNPAGLKIEFPDIRIHRVKPAVYELGITQLKTPAGNLVRSYDAERSVADLIKARSQGHADAQLVTDALSGYFNSKEKDLPKLASICDLLGVREELQVYLEVL